MLKSHKTPTNQPTNQPKYTHRYAHAHKYTLVSFHVTRFFLGRNDTSRHVISL